MKIHNIRLGFANNSSSSHSIILLPNQKDHRIDGFEFGWDNFTAASEASKRQYLALTLSQALQQVVSKEVAQAVIHQWVGGVELSPNTYYNSVDLEGYIDHRSLYRLPMSWDGKGVDYEFFKDFRDYLLQPGLCILGGNDNDGTPHPLLGKGTPASIIENAAQGLMDNWYPLLARKDGSYWTVFNRTTGAKIRFSFNPQAPKPSKASAPELVDLKITDYCPFNCKYCYQSSTTSGKTADLYTLQNIARTLSELKVFEVALGGGEPTLHPDFVKVLKAFRDVGVTPNFSTKNLRWLEDSHQAREILPLIGSFAYSVKNGHDVRNLSRFKIMYQDDFGYSMWTVQHVLGTDLDCSLEHLLTEAAEHHIRVTLLAFKPDGRGSGFKPHGYENWLKTVKKLDKKNKLPPLSIDTPLARAYQKDLAKLDIPELLYETEEGKFSCYLDACEGFVAPASYGTAVKIPVELKYGLKDQLVSAFKEW